MPGRDLRTDPGFLGFERVEDLGLVFEKQLPVGIGGKALCSDTLAYRYFSVSNASQCIAFGPALMDGCVCMTPVSFIIEARDANRSKRVCGMDDFLVRVRDQGGFDDKCLNRVTMSPVNGTQSTLPRPD